MATCSPGCSRPPPAWAHLTPLTEAVVARARERLPGHTWEHVERDWTRAARGDADWLGPCLTTAAELDWPAGIDACVAAGADPNWADIQGPGTPLRQAAWKGQVAAVQRLMEHGADPDAFLRTGIERPHCDPHWLAADSGHHAALACLLTKPCGERLASPFGCNAFTRAANTLGCHMADHPTSRLALITEAATVMHQRWRAFRPPPRVSAADRTWLRDGLVVVLQRGQVDPAHILPMLGWSGAP